MSKLLFLLSTRFDLASGLVVRADFLYFVVVSSSRIERNVMLEARAFVCGLGVRRWAFGDVSFRPSPGRAPKRPKSARGLLVPKTAPI